MKLESNCFYYDYTLARIVVVILRNILMSPTGEYSVSHHPFHIHKMINHLQTRHIHTFVENHPCCKSVVCDLTTTPVAAHHDEIRIHTHTFFYHISEFFSVCFLCPNTCSHSISLSLYLWLYVVHMPATPAVHSIFIPLHSIFIDIFFFSFFLEWGE